MSNRGKTLMTSLVGLRSMAMQQQRLLLIVVKEERWRKSEVRTGRKDCSRRDLKHARPASGSDEKKQEPDWEGVHLSCQWLRRNEAEARLGRGQSDERQQRQLREENEIGN